MGRLRRHAPVTTAFALCAAHLAWFAPFERAIVTDIRYYLYFAWRVSDGAVPHRDLFAVKTQLATFAGAALHAAGDALGADPLLAIRLGYLAIAAAGGALLFAVHRRLAGGSLVAGFLGLAAYGSFALLGTLPAIGNVPKLLMAVLASAAALLAARGRWVAAGAAGALAFMDWQVGALVWVAALAAALHAGRPRTAAAARVAAGGALGLAPFALYYALHGALGATLRQVFTESLLRGSSSLADEAGPGAPLRIARSVELVCPGHEWLFYAGALGMAVVAAWLWRPPDAGARRLLVPLAVYHFGLVGFSLIDIQGYGDYLALLHSAAFFLGATWVALHRAAARALAARRPAARRAHTALAAGALLVAAVAARPGPFHPEIALRAPHVGAGVTLGDQREVAEAVRRATEGRRLVLLDWAELAFLLRHANPLPTIYFNKAAWRHFRSGEGESREQTASRLLRAVAPQAMILPDHLKLEADLERRFRRQMILAGGHRYYVVLWLEEGSPGP